MTVLRVEDHFEALREPVWTRFRARNPGTPRDGFDDAYQEFWAREVERTAAGRPSQAAAPVAFVAEALHRIVIDDLRARTRGVARAEKHEIAVGHLDEQVDQRSADDTAEDARYAAVVHQVLDIVRDRLTERELRVFVASFLYLQSTPAAAASLGLSEARVKKDRVKVAARVGEAVWPLLASELRCVAGRAPDIAAGFEVMADHVEECPACSGLRHGALAVLGPVGLIAPSGGWLDALTTRFYEAVHRVTTIPAAGRGAAMAGLAAAAVAGGVATSQEPAPEARVARPVAVATPTPRTSLVASPTPRPGRRTAPPRRPKRSIKPRPVAPAVATVRPPLRAPPPPVATAASAPSARSAATAAPGEFGFERD